MKKLKKKDIRPILYNWGCGYMLDEYMELFNKIGEIYHKKQLHIPVVVQQSELLKCDQVCDWISIGYAGNGHDECKTCGKTRAFS